MKKTITLLLFVICSQFQFAFAQLTSSQLPTRHYTTRKSFWSEFNLGGNLSKDGRWQYQIDYQYRRAADANYIQGGNTSNIFKDPYQQVVRPWIHYWVKPGAIRFSLSPLGYWITWTPSSEGSVYTSNNPVLDEKGNPVVSNGKTQYQNQGATVFPEFRVCPQITMVQNYGRLQLTQRYRYEFRWTGQRAQSTGFFNDLDEGFNFKPNGIAGSNHTGRLRMQFRAQLPLNKQKIEANTVYLNAWDELFISTGKYIPANKIFNQNRLVGLVGFKPATKFPIKIEAGITYQSNYLYNIDQVPTQLPSVSYGKTNVENNTAYTIYVIFDDLNSLFKKQ